MKINKWKFEVVCNTCCFELEGDHTDLVLDIGTGKYGCECPVCSSFCMVNKSIPASLVTGIREVKYRKFEFNKDLIFKDTRPLVD